jgi:N-acetylglucosamine-6-phosphate deacetylase
LAVLTNARVVQGDQVVDGGWIRWEDERFAEVGRGRLPIDQHLSVGGRLVVPGFVDIHVHGGGGGSFTTGSPEEGAQVAHFHRRHGTRVADRRSGCATGVPSSWTGPRWREAR